MCKDTAYKVFECHIFDTQVESTEAHDFNPFQSETRRRDWDAEVAELRLL